MKLILKYCVLGILFVFSSSLFAQTRLNFVVVDTLDLQVPYPEVGFKNKKKGGIGSERGLVNLELKDTLKEDDLLMIGCPGFETKTIPVSVAKSEDTIRLVPSVRLPELELAKKIRIGKKIGNKSFRNLDKELSYPYRISAIIYNKKYKRHYIQRVNFHIIEKSDNNPKIRIKIYSCENMKPKELLNTQDIIVDNIKQGWNTVVLKERINLPPGAVIITLQTLPSEQKTYVRVGGEGWRSTKKLNQVSSGLCPFSEEHYTPHLRYTFKGFSLAVYINIKKNR